MSKKIFSIILFIYFTQNAYGQAFTYYPFNDVFSISTNPNKVAWADFRLQMNSYFSALSTEISPMISLNKNERAKFYAGAGARFNFLNFLNDDPKKQQPLEGFFLCGGVRASPIAKIPKFQIVFELSPYINKELNLGQFRANLGLGYILGKK